MEVIISFVVKVVPLSIEVISGTRPWRKTGGEVRLALANLNRRRIWRHVDDTEHPVERYKHLLGHVNPLAKETFEIRQGVVPVLGRVEMVSAGQNG